MTWSWVPPRTPHNPGPLGEAHDLWAGGPLTSQTAFGLEYRMGPLGAPWPISDFRPAQGLSNLFPESKWLAALLPGAQVSCMLGPSTLVPKLQSLSLGQVAPEAQAQGSPSEHAWELGHSFCLGLAVGPCAKSPEGVACFFPYPLSTSGWEAAATADRALSGGHSKAPALPSLSGGRTPCQADKVMEALMGSPEPPGPVPITSSSLLAWTCQALWSRS